MIHTIQEFLQWWTSEAHNTAELLGSIHDEDLQKRLVPRFQTIGELSWHLLQTPKELLSKAGIHVVGPSKGSTPPNSTSEILSMHNEVVKSVLKQIHDNWDDRSLDQTARIQGENWRRKDLLLALLLHHIHHRGQLSVLATMTQTEVPPIYKIAE